MPFSAVPPMFSWLSYVPGTVTVWWGWGEAIKVKKAHFISLGELTINRVKIRIQTLTHIIIELY